DCPPGRRVRGRDRIAARAPACDRPGGTGGGRPVPVPRAGCRIGIRQADETVARFVPYLRFRIGEGAASRYSPGNLRKEEGATPRGTVAGSKSSARPQRRFPAVEL